MTDIFDQLATPFDPSEIDWRVGSTNADKTKGMALAYIDARVVMDRLDSVVGPAGWSCRYYIAEGKTVCELSLKCGEEWVTKSDGAGNSDFEAEKGALSDAFKRAAVRWGIGRYLYNLSSPWVAIESRGKTHFITDEGKRTLDALLRRTAPLKTPGDAPPPRQHTSGADPREAKARAWAKTDAPKEVRACKDSRDLNNWLADNATRSAYLLKVDPDLAAELQHTIAVHADNLGVTVHA